MADHVVTLPDVYEQALTAQAQAAGVDSDVCLLGMVRAALTTRVSAAMADQAKSAFWAAQTVPAVVAAVKAGTSALS